MTSGAAAEGIDFRKIIELAQGVLATKSKDLAVAGFLTFGLFCTEGFGGLLEGLEGVEILLQDFWDGLFPPMQRMTGRKNSIEWLNLRLAEQVEAGEAFMADHALLTKLDEKIKALTALVQQRFGEDAPLVAALGRAVQARLKRATPPAVPSKPGAAAPGAASVGVVQKIESDRQAIELARKLGDFYHSESPQSLAAFRLQRVMQWDTLTSEPPSENGRTRIPPPRASLKTQLEGLVSSADWQGLLELCYTAFDEDACLFWLDLQRFADVAAQQLGESAAGLRSALRHDLSSLLERMPNLVRLSFSDGTPFAGEETRSWIESTLKSSQTAGGSDASRAASGEDDELGEHFRQARQLGNAGKIKEALRLLQQGLDADGRSRTRFLRKLEMARVLLAARRASIALPILEELDAEIETYHLAQWERHLALEVWMSLLSCLRSHDSSRAKETAEIFQKHIEEIQAKICQIDIETALASGERS
jgi:type VI secretion system protein VasJ